LAEVLITLTVIGVVAAASIPALNNSTNESQYNVGIKKAQSDFSQVVSFMNLNNDDMNTHSNFSNAFSKYLNVTKIDSITNIFPSTYKFYKSSSTFVNTGTGSALALSNGTSILFFSYQNNCAVSFGSLGNVGCGDFYFDINGNKGPNEWGKDFYQFAIIRQDGTYRLMLFDSVQIPWASCVVNSSTPDQNIACGYMRITNPNNMP